MLLAFDIGNSSVKIAIFSENEKINFGLYPKEDFSCGRDILALITRSNLRYDQITKAIISSVVPNITDTLVSYIKENFNIEPALINNTSNLSITISREFNENIGPDILVMSSYAYNKFRDECLIISLGTASVFSYVNKSGILVGCAIAPGYKTFATSMSKNSALLPDIEPKYMSNYLATNTNDAMSIGSFNGFVGMINDIARNIKNNYCKNPKIILCGGHSDKVKDYIQDVYHQEKDFVINGLNYLSTNND